MKRYQVRCSECGEKAPSGATPEEAQEQARAQRFRHEAGRGWLCSGCQAEEARPGGDGLGSLQEDEKAGACR